PGAGLLPGGPAGGRRGRAQGGRAPLPPASGPAPARAAAPAARRRAGADLRGARGGAAAGPRRPARRGPDLGAAALPGRRPEQGAGRVPGAPVAPRLLRTTETHLTYSRCGPGIGGDLPVPARRAPGLGLRTRPVPSIGFS